MSLRESLTGATIEHYRIGDRLGAGGMGEVYRAEDVRLGRPVALKFLPQAYRSDTESRTRLINEARAASLLRSPNIAVTYDIGEYAGAAFIVMEYVEGEVLSSRLQRGPLTIREATELGIQVADALDEAHANGVVHRDIKSANLIWTPRGLVKVLDFGLAKFVDLDGAAAATRAQVTMAGMVLGTVSYMSPEQALGRPVDNRSDLFSLGVVLFEAATGRMPFGGGSTTEIIDRILHETPPPPSRLNASVPPAYDAIVERATQKAPERRYQSAREMRDALRELSRDLDRPASTTSSRRMAAVGPGAPKNAVAVMTFVNITREATDDWIGAGIAETVSSDLKNVHGLEVVGRARVFDAQRQLSSASHVLDDQHAIDIGRRLGASWVVVGGYQRVADRIRITANFVAVDTGEVVRTVKVDGPLADIFDLQDRIVYDLAQGLNLDLRGSEIAGIERAETRSVEAYESYARGMMNLRQASRESLERAIAAFEDAVARDPQYAEAWAALGGACGLKAGFLGLPELARRAIELEQRALAISPGLADAHAWIASAYLMLGRADEAVASAREAVRLEPENAQARSGLARALWIGQGRFAEAIVEFERTIELNPEAGYAYLQLALLYAWEQRYERAEAIARVAVDLQERYTSGSAGLQIVGAHARLGYVYYLQGRSGQAVAEYEREMAFVSPGDHALREREIIELYVKLGAVAARQGRDSDARSYFDRALRAYAARIAGGADDPATRYYIACAHALRGDRDEALALLERTAAELPALTAARIVRDPDLASLRGDPRFDAIAATPVR
ncbi:MAG TPA: protein kinase [Vicinamibacterales bacterium]|nr:protein kinase [Vicinamibacterales bacterium]